MAKYTIKKKYQYKNGRNVVSGSRTLMSVFFFFLNLVIVSQVDAKAKSKQK